MIPLQSASKWSISSFLFFLFFFVVHFNFFLLLLPSGESKISLADLLDYVGHVPNLRSSKCTCERLFDNQQKKKREKIEKKERRKENKGKKCYYVESRELICSVNTHKRQIIPFTLNWRVNFVPA